MQNGCVFLLAGKTSARSGRPARRLRRADDVHGPVVRQVVWSPWPVVQWSPQCCGSCRSVALHELHSRAGFGLHSTWDRTRGLMFCLVEESESQDPSHDGTSVFSLNSRVLPWGKGRRTESIAQCMSGIGCSLACLGLSKRLGMALPVVSNSCRVSRPAGCAGTGTRTISEFSILSSTDPVLFNCVPARFQTSQSRPGPGPGTESFRCPVDWSCVSVRRSASQSSSRSPAR